MRVCVESRNIATKQHPLGFGSFFHEATIHFKFRLDTVYVDCAAEEHIPHFFNKLEINGLQYLAVTKSLLLPFSWIEDNSMAVCNVPFVAHLA